MIISSDVPGGLMWDVKFMVLNLHLLGINVIKIIYRNVAYITLFMSYINYSLFYKRVATENFPSR